MGEDTAARHIIRVRSGVPLFSAHETRSAGPPKAYKTERNHRARRTSRAAITVVPMVINVQQYVRRGPCVPVRSDDRLLPLSELP
jgi:hypothetical protein